MNMMDLLHISLFGKVINMPEDMQVKLPLSEMVSKSAIDETSLPNSILTRRQANRFIDLVVNVSRLLKQCRTVRVDYPKGEINKLDLGKTVTEGAATTSQATTRVPTERTIIYDMQKYRSAFDLKTDFLEDNIEGVGVRDTLLNQFTKQIANDTEVAAIESDNSLNVGDSEADLNNLLGVNDGWMKILMNNVPTSSQIDAGGKASSKTLYYTMKRAIPKRYRAARPNYVWIVSSGVYDKWMLDWSARETSVGDSALSEGIVPGPWGIPMLEVPLMPESLTYGSTGTDGTQIWLTPLSNLIYFVQREITIEFDRRPRLDVWEVTVHFRADFQVENEDLVVMAVNVSLSGSDY
jgi:hypothetical protein